MTPRLLVAAILLLAVSWAAAAPPTKPHLIYILADDFGYYDVSWKNPGAHTPALDALHASGLEFTRYYTYKFCSPTRSSLLSGRLPIHVNTENNPSSRPGGVDLRMSLVSDKLKAQGYFTSTCGKWHGGGLLEGQLPVHRGFDRSRMFINGNEDHYTHFFGIEKGYDLWQDRANLYDTQTYGGDLYTEHALQTIAEYNATTHDALFMYVAFQNTHSPFQVPARFLNASVATLKNKQTYLAMGSFMDAAVANITGALKERGLWSNSLLIFSADNGGEIGDAGNNYPLSPSKYFAEHFGRLGACCICAALARILILPA